MDDYHPLAVERRLGIVDKARRCNSRLMQGCLLKACLGERIGLSDGGMMGIARTGAQWRHPPEEYGTWNSVFRRYRRRATAGVFDAMLETLASVVERDGRATRSTARSSGHTIVPWALKKGTGAPERQ